LGRDFLDVMRSRTYTFSLLCEDTLASASPDSLREMIKGFAQQMMDAEVEKLCGGRMARWARSG
jgi:hypothetical protein